MRQSAYADGTLLHVIREWLKVAVIERHDKRESRTTAAKNNSRGTPQGGIVSALLSNLYFPRFLLAWRQFGFCEHFHAEVVNDADDLVILCPKGRGELAMQAMRQLMTNSG